MGNKEDAERFDEVLRGPTNLTGAINTASYNSQFVLQPDNEWGDRGFDAENVWYEVNGADVTELKPRATIAELTTDGTQADSKVAVESPTLVYRPGTEVTTSAGLFVDVLPEGDAKYEVLYGREPRTITDPYTGQEVAVGVEYAGFRIVDAPDSSERSHDLEWVVGTDRDGDGTPTEIVVPVTAGEWGSEDFVGVFDESDNGGGKARVYGKDPLDGSGVSNIDFDAREGYVFGIEIGWYAPTALVPYVVDTTSISGTWKQRKFPILVYNPIEGPSITRPNQPIRVVADNGSSGQDLSARLGGRNGSYRGDIEAEPTPDTHTVTGQVIETTGGTAGTEGLNWFVVGVIKSRATDPDTVIAPEAPVFSANNTGAAMARIVDESDITGTIEYDEPSNTARSEIRFAIDAKTDTPDRLSLDTATIDGEDKFVGVKAGTGLITSGGKNAVALTDPQDIFGFTLPRDKVLVYLAATRDNSDVELDTAFRFTTAG